MALPLTLGSAASVTLRVYDMTGRLVATLAEGAPFGAGSHVVRWEPGALPAGVYAVRLTTGAAAEARRVVLVR